MDNKIFYEKYLKYKEKYLFLQQIAAGYKIQKDFTRKITEQKNKITTINNNLLSIKEKLKTAMEAELTSLEAYSKNVDNKNVLKLLNNAKATISNIKKNIETIEKTLRLANSELRKLLIAERNSKESISENNVNYSKKTLKDTQNLITRLNNQIKIAEDALDIAKKKEIENIAKLEETEKILMQFKKDELNKLDNNQTPTVEVVNTTPVNIDPVNIDPVNAS